MSIRSYTFRFKDLPVVTRDIVLSWRGKLGDVITSLSLGIDKEVINVDKDLVTIRDYEYNLKELISTVREGFVYVLDRGRIYPVSLYKGRYYYKLYPIASDKAPTLEISGIKMHRIVGTDPWSDARAKIKILKIKRDEKVLDICTGLGYTAINAYKFSNDVLSIEIDDNVLEIASYNPWSKDLEKIKILLGNAYDHISYFEDNMFDVIIHDPPRLSRAGELYSKTFYESIYRILKPCGRLFHYTGKTGYKRRGLNIMGSVASRLKEVGFRAWIKKDLYGVYAVKPCRD